MLLVLVSTVILGSKYHGTHEHILLSDGYGSLLQSSKLLLVLTSTVVLGFESRQDSYPN
jgi:hypothetical protein